MVKLVGKRTALNTVQRIPEFEINDRVVLQPHTWYTCPAGKKARVKGSVQCTGRGAAATAEFIAAGQIMYRWIAGVGPAIGDYLEVPRDLLDSIEQFALFEVDLSAGGTIVTDQSSGTNAEFNIWARVQETPV